MKTIQIVAILIGIFLIAGLSVSAKPESATADTLDSANTAKNMTFGQCVSQAADIKNTCYDLVKTAQSDCKANVETQTESKPIMKECKSAYKKDKKQCKVDFKSAKKECNKIKHSFIDSIKASWK